MRTAWILSAVLAAGALFAEPAAQPDGAARRAEAVVTLLNSSTAGSPRAYAAAAALVAEDAAAGKSLQQFVMALFNAEKAMPANVRVSEDTRARYFSESRPKIQELAEKDGNPLALYLLALESGDTNTLRRAAEGGNVQAANAWGTALMDAVDGPVPDPAARAEMARACAFFRDAAAMGDANGLYNLGMCYARGLGVDEDAATAYGYFKAAADKGHPRAINNLGWLHLKGLGVPEDHTAAARWFAKSADYGNAEGQLNYALALLRGDGVPVNRKTAAGLLLSSARQGNADAMNLYGMCALKGRGLKPTPRVAALWFRSAADLGHPMAMDNLASCFEEGLGVEKSEEQARYWRMRSLAARGDADARKWVEAHDAAPKGEGK